MTGSSAGAGASASTRPKLLGIYTAWRLRAYGGAIAVLYAAPLVFGYRHGAVAGKRPGGRPSRIFPAVGRAALLGEAAGGAVLVGSDDG